LDEQILLRSIFSDLEAGEYIEVLLVGKDRKRKGQQFVSSVSEAYDAVEDEHNVFFGLCPRTEKSGKKSAVARGTVAWADVDAKDFGDGKAGAYIAATSLVLPASFVADTGYGYQVYWLLNESVAPNELEPVLRELRGAVQGDNVCDAGRRFRLPGTFNVKGEAPVPCTLMRSRPDLRYSLSDLSAATRISDISYRRILTGEYRGFKSRSERDWAVIRELVRLGMSEDTIRLVMQEQPIGDKYRGDTGGEDYLGHTLKRVRERGKTVAPLMFIERDNTYWIPTQKGEKQVSTFVFDPVKLLEGPKQDTLLGDIYAHSFQWRNVPLSKSAFNRTDTLLRELGVAAWQWLGSDKEVRALLPYLMDRLREKGLPRARATGTLGRSDNFWVTPGGIIGRDGYLDENDSPIVYLPTKREAPRVSYTLLSDDEYGPLAHEIWQLLPKFNESRIVWPVLGWAFATPVKPILASLGVRFPTLNLYGTRGSGKTTTLLQIVQPLLGYIEPRTYDCNTTPFVLLSLFASTNAIPIAFSEFRRSTLAEREYIKLHRFVLLSYDVGHDPRGRPDQTTVDYPLSAPFSLDGEDAVSDAAAKERTIIVNLVPEAIAEDSGPWRVFQDLSTLPLGNFAGMFIQATLHYGPRELLAVWRKAYAVAQEAFRLPLPDRVRRNISVCVVGLMLVRKHLSAYGVFLPEPTAEFVREEFSPVLAEIVEETLGRTRLIVDELVEELINEVALPETREAFFYKYEPVLNVLWVHLSTVVQWWFAKRRREGRPVLDIAAIKAQLRERDMSRTPGPGQYVTGRKAVNVAGATKWMYGISIDGASEAGLDIPDRLALDQVFLHLRRRT